MRKLDYSGREMITYPGRALRRTPTSVTLATRWEWATTDLGYVILEAGAPWVETFYTDRWYNIFEIHAVGGQVKGWYCNITRPAYISATEVVWEDLALDLWVDPWGQVLVLDEDEFADLPLTTAERRAAQEALAALRKAIDQGMPATTLGLEKEMKEPLQVVVGRLLLEQGLTLAVAESCTGGLVGHLITDVPGSSEYYLGSVTAYAYEVKERLLGVRHNTLYEHGAVSEETALEMAAGICQALRADIGVSVTGIAGPGGGTPEKPVGLVYIALVAPDGDWVESHVWPGGRQANKAASAEAALDLVRRYLQKELVAT